MSFLAEIFSGGVGSIIKTVGTVVDDISTSDEERIALKNEERKAELDYKVQMKELVIKEKHLAIEDRVSAREANTKVQSSKNASWLAKNIQPVLALLMTAMVTYLCYIMFISNQELSNQRFNLAVMILSFLGGVFANMTAYYFGSSSESGEMFKHTSTQLKDLQK